MTEAVEAPVTPVTEAQGTAPEAPVVLAEDGAKPVQNTEDQAPSSKPEADQPAEAPTPEQVAKRGQARLDRKLEKAYREKAEAQARAKFLEQQMESLKPRAPANTGAPKLEQFTDYAEFEGATAKFYREQGFREYETHQRVNAQKQVNERLVSEWTKKAEAGSEKYEDFEDKVQDLEPSNALIRAVMGCDTADVAYYLATHREEAKRIRALDEVDGVRFIGRLEAKLAAEPERPKTPSKAPAPITPLGGKSGGFSDVPLDTDDIKSWMRKENARMKKSASA